MRQASVLLHLVVENHFEHELIRGEPALFKQDVVWILDLRAETEVLEVGTYVVLCSSGDQTATVKKVVVESTGEIVEIDVPTGAGIGKRFVE